MYNDPVSNDKTGLGTPQSVGSHDSLSGHPTPADFDGHPTQAHADHAHIMKAHEIISDPHRMAAVHALHNDGGGLINYLKKKQADFSKKAPQQSAAANPGEAAHTESAGADQDSDMGPNPVTQAGSKKSAMMG